MKKRFFAAAILFIMLFTVFAACSDGTEEITDATEAEQSGDDLSESTEGTEESEAESEPSAEISLPEEEPDSPNMNLLTGIDDLPDHAVGKRPVAVMVNNISKAMPQYGIDKADVVFEMPVEGYQTRLMCIYADYQELPVICSVRSCRKYFPAIALGFNAVYVNCGQNTVINSYVNSLGIEQYDGRFYGTELFSRDQDRLDAGYGTEHTLRFMGPNFPAQLEKDGVDMNLAEGKTGSAFNFCKKGETVIPEGDECTYIYNDFGSNKTQFDYDSESKTYKMSYFNRITDKILPQTDGKSGYQMSFTNIFILHNDVAFDKTAVYNANGDMHRLVKWEGGKDCVGYYISNGRVQRIYWIKESESDYIHFYKTDGTELEINRGKTYICFNDTEDVTFE